MSSKPAQKDSSRCGPDSPLFQHLQRTRGQPDHHVCYCTLPAAVSPWAPLAPSVPSMSLEGGGGFPASSIFLQAEVGRGELEGAGLRYTSKFSAPQIIRCKKGRRKSQGGWVTQWLWAGLVTWMAACCSGHVKNRAVPSPHLLWSAAAVRRSWRWSPGGVSRLRSKQPPLPPFSGQSIRARQPRPRCTPPPPCTPAHLGISPLDPQAATCSFRARAAPTLPGNFDIVGGCHGEEGDVIDTKKPTEFTNQLGLELFIKTRFSLLSFAEGEGEEGLRGGAQEAYCSSPHRGCSPLSLSRRSPLARPPGLQL